MNKEKALEIARDRIECLNRSTPENKIEEQITRETLEFLRFVEKMLEE